MPRTIHSPDGMRRLFIVQRDDGLFHILEEWLERDDDQPEVTYWSGDPRPVGGSIYDSADSAEREAMTWPNYRTTDSD